ncbi:MAG: DUF58 domain-containing protein [Myxococcaceae bacterium]
MRSSAKPLRGWRRRWAAFWRPPRELKVTTSGRTYLVLTLVVGIGALNTGNNLLYLVLGLQLATIIASGILSERCVRNLSVTRVLPDGCRAGEPVALRYILQTEGEPAFAVEVGEADSPLRSRGQTSFLPPRTERSIRTLATPDRRGPLTLTRIRVTTTFPLGLFAKSRVFDAPQTLWVAPRRVKAAAPTQFRTNRLQGEGIKAPRPGGSGDLLQLREIAFGEDVRRVHWLKSAARGELLRVERERDEPRYAEFEQPSGLTGAALDTWCEATAAHAERLLKQGWLVGLATPQGRVEAASGEGQSAKLLRALATAGFDA